MELRQFFSVFFSPLKMSHFAGGIQSLGIALNPIPNRLGHVTLISGLIPPLPGRNRVKGLFLTN